MVENYRSQFASVLSQDGVEGLIKLFNEKGEELARQVKNSGARRDAAVTEFSSMTRLTSKESY